MHQAQGWDGSTLDIMMGLLGAKSRAKHPLLMINGIM